ncbi:dynein regulatory complex subunit 6-like [Toxorhynchites rutilus septentrionalis]|uniref:dynein regulatory complex subunit 6-like n=1 Tax=Toxorhynchites rutilus septentrionalis TaxID=329112 RepID=UPI00247AEFC4|nr:dynein regulatory complex subunit 6-like [Toxorhynchites rutilus septentrionalis]
MMDAQCVVQQNDRKDRTMYIHYKDEYIYYFEPFFEDLPFEVMVHLLTFLNTSDRNVMAQVCRGFYEGLKHPYFMRSTCLHFREIEFEDNIEPIRGFLNAFRYFPNIKLTKIAFGNRSNFWAEFGESIEELSLDSCTIWKQKLLSILRYTYRLKRLTIQNCPDLFRSWKHIENLTVTCCPVFPELTHISLADNSKLEQYHFDFIVAMAPNLDSLDVSRCFKGIEAAQRFRMLGHILSYLKNHSHQIRHFSVGDTPVDNLFLRHLADIENLRLSSLSVMVGEKIPTTEAGIIDLLRLQTNLTYLDLSKSLALHDSCLIQISNSMPLLETLILNRCWMITDYGILAIAKLSKLKHIDLTNCERITDTGIMGGLLTHKRNKLSNLYLALLTNISELVFTKISFELNHLAVLDLGGCSNCINDRSIQYIFYHMNGLQELNLDCCAKLSDAGMTGIDLPESAIAIWDFEMSFSIQDLKRLRFLNLSGCYKITDYTFRRKFCLLELKELVLGRLQITDYGVEKIAVSCPSLEIIDFSECSEVNDRCVELLAKSCVRLTTLKLQNCPLISDLAIEHLVKYCSVLKMLNIRGCYNITAEAEAKLVKIQTLRHVLANERE